MQALGILASLAIKGSAHAAGPFGFLQRAKTVSF